MPTKNLVSVIIPNYNHAPFLKQRIDSVLSQTFQDFEIIILDDCSTDASREIIEQFRGNPKISGIIYNDQNAGGLFKQWIKGIENAKGKFIWIAESDDYASEDFLEETLKVLNNDASVSMVFTNSIIVDGGNAVIGTSAEAKAVSYAQLAEFDNAIDRQNAVQFLVTEMIISNASSVLFRKSSLLGINFRELAKFMNTGDRFVYLGIALKSKIRYIPKSLNFMRSHVNNTTKKSFENGNIHKDRVRVLNYYFGRFDLLATKTVSAFYRINYLSFIHYGEYEENIGLLRKLKFKNEIPTSFYQLVRLNLFLFKRINIQSRLLKGLFYKILLMQKK